MNDEFLCDSATRIRQLSAEKWGEEKAVELVGRSPAMVDLLGKVEKFARFNEPILIVGESGVGKELFAKACYILSPRNDKPFVSVNCPQYQEGNLTVSELFGHKKGSFTGAVCDRRGLFETADRGVVFLDEIADLHLSAQVMLLRALAEGEFRAVGGTETQTVNVRVIAATNRLLQEMIVAKEFRNDLYFRLCYFRLDVPPLRDRGDDWRLLLEQNLRRLAVTYGVRKTFSDRSLELLASHKWPGNIRELKSIVTIGYSLSDGEFIEPCDFEAQLERSCGSATVAATSAASPGAEVDSYVRMVDGKECFWDAVYAPFMERDLNRTQVRQLLQRGLTETAGNYTRLANLFNVPTDQYHKFMDFLRHHGLKPER
ncbi:MAG: sigma 54-interacting transcriptional regulator [Chthoniobacter sp.]|uniref:sigma 54-interacting transcriptional regulator n=1 Tax=Chthoniobacter sp. TaxID=2510640 RepID=UPI0032A43C1A